ncbi:unnamed protein product [Orchesella dallaii]|uniref:Uncharacterized protein n=1 Tax=Orchesella dallaii TaxID=48710 RepID=A0ABP1RFH6_9HEXA
MFPLRRKTFYFALIVVANFWLGTLNLAAAEGYCGFSVDTMNEVGDTIKGCVKSLNIEFKEEHVKDFENKFEDKGLSLCALQKLNLAKEDGTIEKDKLIKYAKNTDADFGKFVESCMAKSDTEIKGESDASMKAQKKTAFFVLCMNKEFCKDKMKEKM